MIDPKFYENLLDIELPWEVVGIERDASSKVVTVFVEHSSEVPLACPECGQLAKLHDHRKRVWRHLDSCNHKTMIEGMIPRVRCEEHGVKQLPVNFAERNSRFTIAFEQAVLVWLKDDPTINQKVEP